MVAPYATILNIAAEHRHRETLIPVTNPIESTFATVRHRTIRSKGCLSNKTALAMTVSPKPPPPDRPGVTEIWR
jgi:hypothetical protein